MSKLQLYITISHKGYRNQAEINASEKVRQHVIDVSAALDDVKYNPKEKNILYLLKNTDDGVFVTVLRTIPSNPSDHLASWIFIPSDIRISNEEIEDVVKSVVEVVSRSKITSEGFQTLREIFDHQYPTLDNAGATVSNYGNQYAHRFFGANSGYSLSDYIGIHRYQTEYLKYAGVILADKTRVENISGPDLTAMPLEQMVNIFPPLPGDRPYRPLIFGRPFTHPFLVALMQPVEIVWECSGAVDIRQSIMISKPNMRPDNISNPPTQNSTTPHQTTDTYENKDSYTSADSGDDNSTAKVDDSAAKINVHDERSITKQRNEPRFERRPELKTATIDRMHIYNFEIPAKSANIAGMIHFEIHTRATLEGSPIDGYELSDTIQEGASRSNHLLYSPKVSILKTTAWGIAGLISGIILTFICMTSFGNKEAKTHEHAITENTDSTVILQNASDTANIQGANNVGNLVQGLLGDKTLEKAVSYLDSNDTWDKTTLESYPDLRGLYDDMNNMNRERIVNHWGPKLKDSRKFSKIVEHTNKSIKAHKKTRTKYNGRFNPDSKTTVSVRTWLNAVDP